MLTEEEFKKRFKHKLRSFVNDWFFNKERGEKVIQDNYAKYLQEPHAKTFSPEELAKREFASWSERKEMLKC